MLRFLTPNRQVYHIPAVRIMWDLHQASSVGRIEPVLLMNMLDKNLEKRLDAIYAFGVIWRLSGLFLSSFLFELFNIKKKLNLFFLVTVWEIYRRAESEHPYPRRSDLSHPRHPPRVERFFTSSGRDVVKV